MKICFLGDGGSTHIIRWLEYFVNKNYEVHLITFSNSKLLESLSHRNNFHLHVMGNIRINSSGGNWRYIFYLMKIRVLIKKINPNIINAHYITSYGFMAALLDQKRLILSAWGSDILIAPQKNFIYRYITKYSLKKARIITSDSEYMTKIIEKYTNNKVITVPMGVDEVLCNMKRKEHNNEITILSLRTIDKNCNIDIIIKAFKKFSTVYDNSKLIITNSGSELGNIKELIYKLGINNKVEFKGFVKREDLIKLLLSSNIYVSIPSSDSTSVTLLEAMACGIIPIVSNIHANCEWIINNYNGLIIDQNDDDMLYKTLIKATEDRFLKQSCMVENRKIILHRAIWKNNMEIIESEYLKIT
jgi:glycosyltransferase involved in cell wall biosynthesis